MQPISEFVVGALYGPGMVRMMKGPDNGSIMIEVVSEVLKFASGSMSNAWAAAGAPLTLMELSYQLADYARSMSVYTGGEGVHARRTSPIDHCLGVFHLAYAAWYGSGDTAVIMMQQDIFTAFVVGGPPAWYPVPSLSVSMQPSLKVMIAFVHPIRSAAHTNNPEIP